MLCLVHCFIAYANSYFLHTGNQLQEMTKHYKRHQPMGNKTAVPEDVIETID